MLIKYTQKRKHILILCIHKPHSPGNEMENSHNFFSVVQLILGPFRHYFNGSSYTLSFNEGEITEINKNLEEGSHMI
jgi:hypothetical protein